MDNLFFENWQSLIRNLVLTVFAYISLILLLRITGKRTLSKMNAFDFIVTITLGSSLATVALNKKIPLANGVLVFFVLIFLQFIITLLSVRIRFIKKIVTNQPTLLLYKGEVFHDILKRERITIEEIYMCARKKGISNLNQIDAIVIETTGDITIMENMDNKSEETLTNVKNYN